MAEVTIRFRHNPNNGRRELVISYESESDALPHEHERDHKALVEKLLGIPITDDLGDIVVERIEKGQTTEEPDPQETIKQREAQSQKK
jgi:hypothetical protein